MIRKTLASILVVLHIFTFCGVRDGLASLAESASYKLDTAAYGGGGGGKQDSASYKIVRDSIGQAIIGQSERAGYKVNSGYTYVVQSNPPEQTQAIPNADRTLSWKENESNLNAFDLDKYFKSEDGLLLSYTVSRVPGSANKINITINSVDNSVSFSQPQGWSGQETVYFTATDTDGNSTPSDPVTLVVEGINNPPILEFISDKEIAEDQSLQITVTAADIDLEDTLTYSASNLPRGAQFNADTRTFTWKPDYSQSQSEPYAVTFTVTDSTQLSDSQVVKIKVLNVNRAPVFTSINGISVTP
ncbi:MAG: putative Ig domain-containing protein, partial [Candidatus Omnitrophica bacterium]|nr:putative Ig domain-containing protein [Candidatus Omnitrophota bacterium]